MVSFLSKTAQLYILVIYQLIWNFQDTLHNLQILLQALYWQFRTGNVQFCQGMVWWGGAHSPTMLSLADSVSDAEVLCLKLSKILIYWALKPVETVHEDWDLDQPHFKLRTDFRVGALHENPESVWASQWRQGFPTALTLISPAHSLQQETLW